MSTMPWWARGPAAAGFLCVLASIVLVGVAQADGGEIAYITNDSRSIHLVQADGTGDRQLLTGTGLATLAWSPDGNTLAYTQSVSADSNRRRILLYDLSSRRSTELNIGLQTIGSVAYFPDGKHLAAVSTPSQLDFPRCGDSQYLSIDIATAKATPFGLSGCALRVQVAPDGGAVIASRCSGAPACNVVSVSYPSGAERVVTDPTDASLPFSSGAAVSPDNSSIAFAGHRGFLPDSPSDLDLADRDGSNQRVVLEGNFDNTGFAPSGQQLVVSRSEGSASAGNANDTIWVVGIDGSNARQIAVGMQPAWRPTVGATAAPGSVASPAAAPGPAAPTAGSVAADDVLRCGSETPQRDVIQHLVCPDGSTYVIDFTSRTASRTPSGGPWQIDQTEFTGIFTWSQAEDGRQCKYFDGGTSGGASIECTARTASDSQLIAPSGDDATTGQAVEHAEVGARVLEAHSPACLPRCFTFLYVVQGDTVWQPSPSKISPADLAKLQRGPDLHVTLSVPRNDEPAQLFILDDGTDVVKLYLVQGDTAWLVVPQDITDQQMSDLAKLNAGGTLEGALPPELLGSAESPGPAQPPSASPVQSSGPTTQPASALPEVLTDSVRSDILAAVDRANAAWTAASQSLDASALSGNVAGQELSDDRAELDKLRSQGHTQTNVNTSFSVLDVRLNSPGHAVVATSETWYAEIRGAGSGQLIQRTPPSAYRETYTVDYQDGGWIVTKNDVS